MTKTVEESDKESGECSSFNGDDEAPKSPAKEEVVAPAKMDDKESGEEDGAVSDGELPETTEKEQKIDDGSEEGEIHHHHFQKVEEPISSSSSNESRRRVPKDSTLFKVGKQITKKESKKAKRKRKALKKKIKNQAEKPQKIGTDTISQSSSSGSSFSSNDQSECSERQEPLTHYLKYDLCKYFMANNCQRGEQHGTYSHQTKRFPCKWIHATGMCDKGENCRFSHNILNSRELQKFMKENNDFLEERILKEGKTNLGVFFIRFREESARAKNEDPKSIMVPNLPQLPLVPEIAEPTNPEVDQPSAAPIQPQILQAAPQLLQSAAAPSSILANYQKQMMLQKQGLQQPPVLTAPAPPMAPLAAPQPPVAPPQLQPPPQQQAQVPQLAPPQPAQQQQLALLQLQLLMSAQQQQNLKTQKQQALMQIDILNQQIMHLSLIPTQQQNFLAIQIQLNNGQQTILQLQNKMNDLDLQINAAEMSQNDMKVKIAEIQRIQQQPEIQRIQVQQPQILQPTNFGVPIQLNQIPQIQQFAPVQQTQSFAQPIQAPPQQQVQVQPQAPVPILQQQQQVAPPLLQPPPQVQASAMIPQAPGPAMQSGRNGTQNGTQQLTGLYSLLGQLKHQVETTIPDKNRPEMKKIEADLQALINNKKYTGELNATQQKLMERVKNKTGMNICSSSSSDADSSLADRNQKQDQKNKQSAQKKKWKNKYRCLFESKDFKDYDSDSLSITSDNEAEFFQIRRTMRDCVFGV